MIMVILTINNRVDVGTFFYFYKTVSQIIITTLPLKNNKI